MRKGRTGWSRAVGLRPGALARTARAARAGWCHGAWGAFGSVIDVADLDLEAGAGVGSEHNIRYAATPPFKHPEV